MTIIPPEKGDIRTPVPATPSVARKTDKLLWVAVVVIVAAALYFTFAH